VLVKTLLGVLTARPGPVGGDIVAWRRTGDPVHLLAGLEHAVTRDSHEAVTVSPRWYMSWRDQVRPFWGVEWGYVTQHGARALDPTRPVGQTLFEALERRAGRRLPRTTLFDDACAWLARLRLQDPARVLTLYPKQLSGGMAQRFTIAVALARGARVLFADEPTTGLDPDSQDALLETLAALRAEGALETLVLITHDLDLARRLAEEVVVMERGRVVESSSHGRFFGGSGPESDVAIRMLEESRRMSRPRAEVRRPATATTDVPRLRLRGVSKRYESPTRWRSRRSAQKVLDGVSLDILPGEVVGLVGPSGSGKTTLARIIARLSHPDSGRIELDGANLLQLRGKALRKQRRIFQLLFQQVTAAIHPRMRVEEALMETARHVMGLRGEEAQAVVDRTLDQFHLRHCRRRLGYQLSGGEARRVGLARALMVRPRLLVADEPTTGIDASLRPEVLETLTAMVQTEESPSILLISHDRRVMSRAADRVLHLHEGRVEEAGPATSAVVTTAVSNEASRFRRT